ncbi:hypothetical protein EVAR_84142_1 [Eumeta japonica]|uniref:Uncharacterized protein n=1 Tax=Eumeta variegata TaxID=151549 RepID=A0A4C2ACG4_EUMVA|nr:hypothetical protein EVAR_84142_1 [Eumeta japonica]
MAALTGPSAEPSFGRLCTPVPSQLADIPNIGFLNNGYRNFRLAASAQLVVANLLRCKLDCINRRDTRSVHPSVDDPSAVCVRSSAARAPAASSTPPSTEPYHPIFPDPHSELNAPCAVSSQPAFVQFSILGLSILSGPACYASVLPAAVAPLGHFFAKTLAMSVSRQREHCTNGDWSHTGRLEPHVYKTGFIER